MIDLLQSLLPLYLILTAFVRDSMYCLLVITSDSIICVRVCLDPCGGLSWAEKTKAKR